jgi:DNA-binding NarL/FixJ family response regulator
MTVRVLLADDQALLRLAFKVIIDSAPDLEVVGEASTGREAVQLARRTRPDVVLMDVRMPDMDGLTATRLIASDENLVDVRVLIITTFDIDEYVFQAVRAGASGFVGKGVEPGELIEAIRVVNRGDALLSPTATKALIARFLDRPDSGSLSASDRLTRLTDREREVLTMVAAGMPNDEIAQHLVISVHTAKTHVKRAMAKLGAHDRAQLVVIAYETGVVRPGAE